MILVEIVAPCDLEERLRSPAGDDIGAHLFPIVWADALGAPTLPRVGGREFVLAGIGRQAGMGFVGKPYPHFLQAVPGEHSWEQLADKLRALAETCSTESIAPSHFRKSDHPLR